MEDGTSEEDEGVTTRMVAWQVLTARITVFTALFAFLVASLWTDDRAYARPAPDSFADLVEKLSPAVVNISTTTKVDGPRGRGPRQGMPNSPFEEFFRDFFGQGPNGGRGLTQPREVRSLGSGFVIDAKGHIVTNNHVVGEATEIVVTFDSGLSLDAKLVATDDATDLAVLKVEHDKPLPFVKFGNSDGARVGDWVLAIGNPFNIGRSVTAGIISARNRDIQAGRYDDFIQTDAAINRGNSGGPLFDINGEVIGVNTVIISPTGGSIGIGFAISSALAEGVVQQLIEHGEARRGWLGVRIQNVSDDIAESFGLKEARGALVAGVNNDSPAQKAKIAVGDVILSFDGKDVDSSRDLSRIVAATPIGKSVPVEVWREGRKRRVSVKVGQLDEERLAGATGTGGGDVETEERQLSSLGMTLGELTPTVRSRYDVEKDLKGVIVLDVEPGSPAAGRVRVGDVIVEMDQKPVSEPSTVERKIEDKLKGKKNLVLFQVSRQGMLVFVPVRFEEEDKE